MAQTQIQNEKSIRFGSAKIEIGKDEESLVNIGALRGIEITESMTKNDIKSDNAGTIKSLVSEHKVELKANMLEIDLDVLEKIRGGIDSVSLLPGEKIEKTHTFEKGSYATETNILIPFSNFDESVLEVLKVEAKDGATVRVIDEADYAVSLSADKKTEIVFEDASVDPATENIVITFNHAPNGMKVFTTGGRSSVEPSVVRVTNTNDKGKMFRVTIYKATSGSGLGLSFQSDEATDVMASAITLTGNIDASREVGDQLFKIEDEQGV